MSYIVTGKTPFKPAPEDLHGAVCVDLIDLGLVDTKFGRKEQIRLVWELDPTTAGTLDDGRRFTIRKTYTPSLHEKSTLHKDLKAWRGRPFTGEELAGFDLECVVGAPCKLLVQHVEREGTVYANIAAIMKADGNAKLLPSGEYIRFKDRPEQEQQGSNSHGGFSAPAGEDAVDIPF